MISIGAGRRPDKDDAGLLAGPREAGVLGEEPVTGVDRLRAGGPRGSEHPFAVEVGLAGRGRAEPDGDVGGAYVPRPGVGVAVDGDGAHAEPAQGGDHADGDLPAVGDEDGAEHVPHIRKTP